METPVVSVVIPTRNRAAYLDVALASLATQQLDRLYEVVVADDCSDDRTPEVARRWGAGYVRAHGHRGANAARNAGIRAAAAPLIAFLDDDIEAPPGWLQALVEGAERHPEAEAFGGPIRARFEGPTPSSCGRENPPITTLDLGARDADAEMVWSANMAIRRSALERIGPFDEAVLGHAEEEDWLLALRAAGGRIVYLAGAGVDHRRTGADAGMRALAITAYRRGRAARESNQRHGVAPSLARELRVLAGCAWHTVRYRCPQGVIMGAHSAGRIAHSFELRAPRSASPRWRRAR